jgi:hypothetical protein
MYPEGIWKVSAGVVVLFVDSSFLQAAKPNEILNIINNNLFFMILDFVFVKFNSIMLNRSCTSSIQEMP